MHLVFLPVLSLPRKGFVDSLEGNVMVMCWDVQLMASGIIARPFKVPAAADMREGSWWEDPQRDGGQLCSPDPTDTDLVLSCMPKQALTSKQYTSAGRKNLQSYILKRTGSVVSPNPLSASACLYRVTCLCVNGLFDCKADGFLTGFMLL